MKISNRIIGTFTAALFLTVVAVCFQNCTKLVQTLPSSALSTGTSPTISWAPNRETAVNSLGGGYKVYYSTNSGFNLGTANVINVPYVSGAKTPSSVALPSSLSAGTYYIVVVAYSAVNPVGGNNGSTSAPSAQTSITIH